MLQEVDAGVVAPPILRSPPIGGVQPGTPSAPAPHDMSGVLVAGTSSDAAAYEIFRSSLVDHFAAELPELMCDLGLERFGFEIPLAVDVKTGPTMGDLKPWKNITDDEKTNAPAQ